MNKLKLLLAGVLLSGCGFKAGSQSSGDDGGLDASQDGPTSLTFGSFVKVTFDPKDVPTAPLKITENTSINTDSSPLCDTQNDQAARYCVVVGATIEIAAAVSATGSKPLILLSVSSFELSGTLDISSKRGGQVGAGAALAAACTMTTAPTAHGGGYGGSFGGAGGAGESTNTSSGGVAAPALTAFTELRGGCPGGAGSSDPGGMAGAGGAGGGAVDIIATSIKVSGAINASGAAGGGGTEAGNKSSGGGGGGAGGMIVLDAPSVSAGTTPPSVYANGGGGGQGGTGADPGKGPGADGREPTSPQAPASGGATGSRGGGAGGAGGAGVHVDGAPGQGHVYPGGGGGGGGGVGFIRAPAFTGGDVSPTPINP